MRRCPKSDPFLAVHRSASWNPAPPVGHTPACAVIVTAPGSRAVRTRVYAAGVPARPSSADRRPPSPEDLRDAARFGLVAELPHDAVVPALQPYLRGASPVMVAYWVLNVVLLGVLAAVWRRSGLPAFDAFSTACLGMTLGYLALVPVHEAVHAAAYRAAGARRVAVTYS